MPKQNFPARFLRDVAEHKLKILRDDGVYRHLRVGVPGDSCMHFEIVTWPGYLAYVGDMGAFTFTRLRDMFAFFREKSDEQAYEIDLRYWAEKCEAAGARGSGLTEFDPDEFRREIRRQRRQLLVEHGRELDEDERRYLWDAVGEVMDASDDGEERAMTRAYDFDFTLRRPGGEFRRIRLDTDDFPRCQRYTMRFVWCCHALRFAISLYDKAKEPAHA